MISPTISHEMTVRIMPSSAVSHPLQLVFAEIDPAQDAEAVAAFLSRHHWPFHARSTLSMDEARQIELGPSEQVRSFWIKENRSRVGLVRVFDLEDADDGASCLTFGSPINAEAAESGVPQLPG